MGRAQTSTGGSTQQEQRVEASPEERELNRLQLEREKYLDPQIRDVQSSGLNLTGQLLRGESNLPGWLKEGIGIGEGQQKEIVASALRDIYPQFQQSGLLDSGVAASAAARTAGDLRRGLAEFNIGAKQNLLNLALSGQASVQQPILGFSSQISNRLAGLRTTTGNNTFGQQTFGPTWGQQFGTSSASALGGWMCWVAAELFGGWDKLGTHLTRNYMMLKAPLWLAKLYLKYGQRFAKFISDKPMLKKIITPLFEWFAKKGEECLYGN